MSGAPKSDVEPVALSGRTLADRAFEWLEEAIIKGDYPPEYKLDEVSLAKAFGISRGPIREAIRRLEGKKLVERVPHVGARVASHTNADLVDLLYIREALEGTACRLACERMSDEEIASLSALLTRHAEQGSLKAGENYYQRPGDYDFHFRIIQASRNSKLISMLTDDLYHLLRIYRYRSSSRKGRAQDALAEHQAILAALTTRKPLEAERLMRQHVEHARLSIMSDSAASEVGS